MSIIEKAIETVKARRLEPDRTGRYRSLPPDESAPTDASPAAAAAAADAETAEARFDLGRARLIAADPEVMRQNRILIDSSVRQPAEGAYRMLRTRVMRAMRGRHWSRLGITAAGSNEGKTVTAVNLAVSIAAERTQPVVLVDLDLRRPKISQYLGLAPQQFPGLGDHLADGKGAVEDLLFSPGIDGLYCILNARPLDRSSDLLASPRGKAFMADLKRKFADALLIFDLPPLLATDDPLVVAPMIDAVLFVVADQVSIRSEVASAAKQLQEFNVIGAVLNRATDPVKQGYYEY